MLKLAEIGAQRTHIGRKKEVLVTSYPTSYTTSTTLVVGRYVYGNTDVFFPGRTALAT